MIAMTILITVGVILYMANSITQDVQLANQVVFNGLASCAAAVDFLKEEERYKQKDARVYAYGVVSGAISTTLGIIQHLEVKDQQNPIMVNYLKSRREKLLSLEVALRNSIMTGDIQKAEEAIDKYSKDCVH